MRPMPTLSERAAGLTGRPLHFFVNSLSEAELRDLIATEREQARAFGPVAEAARDELAKRTGSAQV